MLATVADCSQQASKLASLGISAFVLKASLFLSSLRVHKSSEAAVRRLVVPTAFDMLRFIANRTSQERPYEGFAIFGPRPFLGYRCSGIYSFAGGLRPRQRRSSSALLHLRDR